MICFKVTGRASDVTGLTEPKKGKSMIRLEIKFLFTRPCDNKLIC